MKNKFKLLSLLLIANGVYAQQNPTNTNPGGAASGMQSQQYWSRAGNNNNNGANNIFGTLWNSPIYTQTNGVTRIVLRGGGTGNNDGRMALGNNLVGAFTPANRLHLHQTGGDFGIQFTNNTTGNSASNGFGMDLLDNGRFQFSQYQNQDVRFQMPNSLLMQLIWNNGPNNGGQVKIGPTSNPPLSVGNLMYNPALVNLGGALAFSHPAVGYANNTLIYYNTAIDGDPSSPSRDGFRMKYHFASEGVMQGDCLVFEKTDGQSAEPDGCIKFTNYGNDDVQKLSMTIEGDGHVGIGRPYTHNIKPWRRLSVQDTAVQFRITHTASNLQSYEIYTDFYTDAYGNLKIDPRKQGNANAGTVKINYGTNLTQPYSNVSLDVNGQMNVRTVNQDNTLTKVLVWEETTGNVRYADASAIGGGPSGGIIAAQNGLNLINPTTVELGGGLLHNTEVTLNNYDMVFNNSYGNFIVGNTNLQTPGNNVHQNIILGLNNNINIMPAVSPNGWMHRILGNNNTVYSHQNHIFGNSNEVGMANDDYAGVSDFIIGENNKAHITTSANQSYVFGKSNQVEGFNSFAFGIDNKATHEDAYCFGNKNIAPHWRAQAIGNMVYAPYYTVSIGNGSNNSGSANNIQNYVAGGGDLNNIHSDPTFTTQEDIPAININLVNNVAIKKYSATSALDVNGNILQSGNAVTSDATLKHNIQDYEVNADSLLNLLQPRTFEWNTIADTFMLGTQYGFIAQEFEQVIPEYVRQGADGIRHINTGALFPLLVLGYKHQSSTIDSLETVTSQLQANNDSLQSQVQDLNNRLSQLENCLSGILPFLCQLNHDAIQATTPAAQEDVRKNLNVILNNREAIILDQNVPNPFAEQTVINFTIPTSVQKAQIHFYDGMGKLLQSVEITERGQGSITVFGADLSSGIYTYNLVADGQIVATKKMMRE